MMSRGLADVLRGELPWVVAAQAVSFIGGFAIVKLLAIALGTEGFGYYSLCLSLAAMISLLWYGPLDQIILRYWSTSQEEKGLLFQLAISGHLLAIFILVPASLCLWLASMVIEDAPLLEVAMLAMLLSIPKGMFGSTLSFHNASRNRQALFRMQALDILSRLTMIGAFHLAGLTASLAIILTMLSAALPVFCSAAGRYGIRNIFGKIHASIRQFSLADLKNNTKHIRYGRSFILIGVFAATCNYADRWIIQQNLTLSDVGIYSGIAQIATAPLIAITTVFTQFLSPIMFSKSENSKLNATWIYIALSGVYGSLSLLFFAVSEQIIRLLLTPEFLPYHRILPALTLGLSFFYMAQIYFIKVQKNERPHIIKPAWISRTLAMLVLGVILTREIGIWGLAVAIIFSSTLFLAVLVFLDRNIEINKKTQSST